MVTSTIPESLTLCGSISLRDYFATQTLQGIIIRGNCGHIDGIGDDTYLSSLAYRYADAMLKEKKHGE